jgi:hypothetical protein
LKHSVFGGGVGSNGGYRIIGTMGQPAIDVASGSSDINQIGFWYLPTTPITDIEKIPGNMPTEYRLEQNYPNPFNPTTTIRFAMPKRSSVSLKVFDMLGREVTSLVDEELQPAEYSIVFDANGLSSGMYIYRIQMDRFVQSKKLLLLK